MLSKVNKGNNPECLEIEAFHKIVKKKTAEKQEKNFTINFTIHRRDFNETPVRAPVATSSVSPIGPFVTSP